MPKSIATKGFFRLMHLSLLLLQQNKRKKGKRDAEEIVEKQLVSSKKQKVVKGGMSQAIEKKKVETKTSKKAETGPETLFMGNLSLSIEEADVVRFFEFVAVVVEVRFAMRDDRFAAYGYVQFATPEAAKKALQLNGRLLNGRPVKLRLSTTYTPGRNKRSFQSRKQGETLSISIGSFIGFLDVFGLMSILEACFSKSGEMTFCSVPEDSETGRAKGLAFLEFEDRKARKKALEFCASNFYGITSNGPPSGGGRSGGRFGDGDGGREEAALEMVDVDVDT